MTKFSNILKIALVVCMLCALCVVFAACGGKDGGALIIKGQPPRAIRGDLAEILTEEVRRYAQEH